MANQNFRVKNGLEVGVGGTILYAEDTGRIGINISSPSSTLTVKSPGASNTFINALNSGSTSIFSLTQSLGGSGQLKVGDSTGNTFFTVDSAAAYVGIGTDDPGTELHVQGNNGYAELRLSGQSGSGATIEFYDATTKLSDFYTDPSSNIIFRNTASNTERLRITSGGNAVFSGGANPTIDITGTSGSAIIKSSDRDLNYDARYGTHVFKNNGSEQVRINSSGNLGIATDSPSQKLDVNGGARFRGAIYDNNNAVGAANSVLSSTGSGVQWVSVSAGSDADTLDGLDSSQFLRSDTDDDAQGFGSRANVNTTGDPGLLITNGGRLGFDQSGTRSWTIKATGGNLAIASGDGSGSLTYNSNTVWHAGNHGSGSGLDADFLDGISSASFLRSDTGDTFTGTVLSIESTTDGKLALKCPSGDTSDWNYIEYYGTNGTRDGYVGTNSSGLLHVSQDGGSTLEMSTTSGLAYLNSNKIWTAGNDGSGSGLDADTVDGIQASSFLRSDAADIATGPISWTGTLATFDPGGSPGTDTATDVALALASGHRLAGHDNGYIRTLLEWNTGSDIEIGQSATALIGGINLLPGSSGVAKVNGNTIWHAGNDGSGSGLDADTVDGIQGASFLRSDAADTGTGSITLSTGTVRPLSLQTSSASPWHLELYRSDIALSSNVFAHNSPYNGWYFQHNISIAGSTNWHSGNDGSGTGLDADLLDGLQSSNFERRYSGSGNTSTAAWYTIAANAGNRASAKFTVNDTTSGAHQTVHFYASHFYGNGSAITLVHQNRYSTSPIRYIRIKEGGTYDGALLQIYIESQFTGSWHITENTQNDGWVATSLTADGTNPGTVSNFSALNNVAAQVDVDQGIITNGGNINTTGNIYAGGATSQNLVWHAGNDGAGSGVDADNLDGYTWGSSGKDLRGTEIYADNWFRNYDSGEGLYNQANGNHWYSDAANYWNVTLGGSSNGGIRIRDSHAGTVRGYFYANNSNDVGFLSSSGNWRIRVVGGDYTNIDGSSIRAPLFYDINNTGYYVDPASTSVINTTYIGSGGVRFEYGNNNRNLYVKSAASDSDVGISLFDNNGNHRVQLYGDAGTNYGFLNGNWASWDLRKTKTGNMYLNNQSTYYYGTSETYMSRVYGITDIRSPIYYDYDDTGYYINAASTSRVSRIDPSVIHSAFSGTNSGISRSTYAYGFGFQETGAWSGSYPDLVLQYHTGVTMSANASYDGITFKADYNNDTVIFRVNGSSNYLYKYYWMYTNTSGFYSDTNSAHLHPNTTTSYGVWRIQGARNSYTGIVYENADSTVSGMFDGSGNGGDYNHSTGWHYYYHRGNDCLGVSGSATSGAYELYVSGDIYATGTITAASDARLKRNIETIESPLDKVLKLRGVTYEWDLSKAKKRKKGTKMGLVAQEVVEVVPEVVTYAEDVDEYSVEYGNLTALLIEAVKEQNEIINTMRQEINDLKSKLGE